MVLLTQVDADRPHLQKKVYFFLGQKTRMENDELRIKNEEWGRKNFGSWPALWNPVNHVHPVKNFHGLLRCLKGDFCGKTSDRIYRIQQDFNRAKEVLGRAPK